MKLELEVRDYECDLQGIVNNARYVHYLEHARHKALAAKNVNFSQLSADSKDLVVTEAHLKYHKSLLPGDKFFVETDIVLKSKIRLLFKQKIYKVNDSELCLEAETLGVCLDRKTNKVVEISSFIQI